MLSQRAIRAAVFLISLAALGAGVGVYSARYYRPAPPEAIEGLLWPHPKRIGNFSVVDQNDAGFGLDRLRGHWSWMYFGYTHCPDICPVTLALLAQVAKLMPGEFTSGDSQVVFVSVDPERDTPEHLREYLRYFDPRFIGLGGTVPQVRSLTSQLGVVFEPVENRNGGDYTVNHSASIFLLDPGARMVSIFTPPEDAQTLVTRFHRIRDFIRQAEG